MNAATTLLVLCACGQAESATVHHSPDGHKYAPIRGADQFRDDQEMHKGSRRGHYALAEQRIITLASPAVGLDWSAPVPATARWRVNAVQAQLATSAVVANRVPHIIITDGQAHTVYNVPSLTNQVAATTFVYSAGATVVTAFFDSAVVMALPYPLKMLQNWTIASLTTGIQAGDQWSNIVLFVKEWLQF
ncbi:MAG TPA: hypothetical protein VNZ03_14890 [Terriglobales bacterium]|jgi:hypothetical protein|nr:hypothetical protein [Terriglobales bacterium]